MRILWAIFGIKMYALWYLHPSAKTKKTKAAALPMPSEYLTWLLNQLEIPNLYVDM